jgi:hypothetical protein
MPNFTRQFGAQSICERPKSSRSHFRDISVGKHLDAFTSFVAVNASAERLSRHAFIHRLIRRDDGHNGKWPLQIRKRPCF